MTMNKNILEKSKIILIQGALDIEISYMIDVLHEKSIQKILDYEFYEGTINNVKIVISKTLVGTINATLATTIGILNFHPDIVINQGLAGSHLENLHVGDIVIGEQCSNINAYKMPLKNKGEGSNPFEWELNKRAKDIQDATSWLVDLVEKSLKNVTKHKIHKGIFGSGDVFNREYDRITWINNVFHNLCEDMESISTYSVCNKFKIPCVGIRIISNNELLHEAFNKEKAIELQKAIINMLSSLLKS